MEGVMLTTSMAERKSSKAVLVVDDDPNGLRVMTRLLTDAGYQAVAAYGADDAWQKLGRQRFDVALVELAMKRVSGIRLIEMIKTSSLAAVMPVLAVTTPVRRSLARDLGCDDFVFRPIDPAALLRTVWRVCTTHPESERTRRIADATGADDGTAGEAMANPEALARRL